MPDDTLMTLGSIVFTAGSIVFLVTALLAVGPLPGLASGPASGFGSIVYISAASALAGVFVLLIGGLREGDRGRVVYVRRTAVPATTRPEAGPKFCATCGSPLASDSQGLVCPACGLRM